MSERISESERARRQEILDFAYANVGLERLMPSEKVIAAAQRWARGEISFEELQIEADSSLSNRDSSEI